MYVINIGQRFEIYSPHQTLTRVKYQLGTKQHRIVKHMVRSYQYFKNLKTGYRVVLLNSI